MCKINPAEIGHKELTIHEALSFAVDAKDAVDYVFTAGQGSCFLAIKDDLPVYMIFDFLAPKCLVGMKCEIKKGCDRYERTHTDASDYCDRHDREIETGQTDETRFYKHSVAVTALDDTNRQERGFVDRILRETDVSAKKFFRIKNDNLCGDREKGKKYIDEIYEIIRTSYGKTSFDKILFVPYRLLTVEFCKLA